MPTQPSCPSQRWRRDLLYDRKAPGDSTGGGPFHQRLIKAPVGKRRPRPQTDWLFSSKLWPPFLHKCRDPFFVVITIKTIGRQGTNFFHIAYSDRFGALANKEFMSGHTQ